MGFFCQIHLGQYRKEGQGGAIRKLWKWEERMARGREGREDRERRSGVTEGREGGNGGGERKSKGMRKGCEREDMNDSICS